MTKNTADEEIRVPRRKPSDIDELVGRRLRLRRTLLSLTQAELAERCFVSPQQIHKYEQGSSRMTIARLVQFSAALDVPVSWFLDGAEAHPQLPDDLLELLASRDTGEMVLLLRRIREPHLRQGLLEMARRCAEGSREDAGSRAVDTPSASNVVAYRK